MEQFYAPIQGFNFEEGQLQKIRVEIEKLDPENVPADASNLKYTLLEIKEKRTDLRYVLQGSWVLDKLNDKSIDASINKPTLAINLSTHKISGNNSCNNYVGSIEKISSQTLVLGNIASTRKMCQEMNIATQYTIAANKVRTYKIENNNLIFYDGEGNKILTFIKNSAEEANQNVYDIWATTSIEGNPINRMVKAPRLEVNLTKMQVMGNDGCNNFSGAIESIDANNIMLGNIVVTQKACKNMEVSSRFNKALIKSKKYKVEHGKLTFYDGQGEEILTFLKTD